MSVEPGRRHERCAPMRASLPLSVSGLVSRIALIQNVSAGISLLRERLAGNRVGDEMPQTSEKPPPRLAAGGRGQCCRAAVTGNGTGVAREFPTPKRGFRGFAVSSAGE